MTAHRQSRAWARLRSTVARGRGTIVSPAEAREILDDRLALVARVQRLERRVRDLDRALVAASRHDGRPC